MFWFLIGVAFGYVLGRFFYEGLEQLARAIWAKRPWNRPGGGGPPTFV